MMFLRKRNFTKADGNREQLLCSVVSLYLYMSRSARHRDKEIAFIDHLLHSMFGSEIPLYEIEQARLSELSVREAANILSRLLQAQDRIKLILNLICLAYHQRSQIQVLGSVEIVELADLLRLDVNILDLIYDLFEGKADSVLLPIELSQDYHGSIKNSMLWAPHEADIKTEAETLHFLMIEDLVLVRNLGSGVFQIRDKDALRDLTGEEYHLILPQESLDCEAWSLEYKDLWQIYRHMHSLGSLENYLQRQSVSASHSEEQLQYFLERNGTMLNIHPVESERSLIRFFKQEQIWQLEPLQSLSILVNMQPLNKGLSFSQNTDLLTILGRNYIVNRHWELIEIPLQISELKVQDVWHYFQEDIPALRGISFTLQKSTMTAVMGPSGSGKTTLLQVILGEIKARRAKIQLDSKDMGKHFSLFQRYIAYVPQDDLLFANLSVYENLYYRLKLSLPELKDPSEIRSRIHNLLRSVDLYEQRGMLVGDVNNKKLSGGQRRRLNIALELVSGPAILILDEPTSGLSSKDSESIIQLLGELRDQGKIVISTIHQPNATIFNSFDKVLLMDKGGVQVYFGDTSAAFDYFAEELQEIEDSAITQKLKLKMPEFFFDLVEYRNAAEERIFDPDYWDKKFRAFSFLQALNWDTSPVQSEDSPSQKAKPQLRIRNLAILFRRNFLNKSRSSLNLLMTLFAAPFLALLIAFVLRSTGGQASYSYFENLNAVLFDFIAVIIFIFIGLANSIDDILSEKRILQRELKMGISAICQLSSKHLVLFLMTCLQALLFYLISSLVLGMRGFLLPKFIFYTLSGMTGYSLGLLFSSMIKDRSAMINILPLVIIPQIMFSGLVIEFGKMNPALRINQNADIPEFCQLIPSRWLLEGLVIGSSRHSFLAKSGEAYSKKRKELIASKEMTAKLSLSMADDYQVFLDSHPQSRYANQSSNTLVNISQGRYTDRQANAFLSYRMRIFGQEVPTVVVDFLVSLLFIALAAALTVIRLKRYLL
ncbi:MAG: ATP-binding cassette domain-containing protein [Candidatus Cloacimonetes bacterium]|nr:ATP-binding cassette domain-containing protein [Candidatus Cloacimonadota bacterium]